MASADHSVHRATAADLFALPAEERFHEVIDGKLVRKAHSSFRHGAAQVELAGDIGIAYGPRACGRGPGGWVFATEVEIAFELHQVLRPDLAGWRRERLPRLPEETPVTLRPDWVCEILSPSTEQHDLFKKLRIYARNQVSHYWILDPDVAVLWVYRWTAEGYLLVQTAEGPERIPAEPFDAVELSVQSLLGGEDGPDAPDAPDAPPDASPVS